MEIRTKAEFYRLWEAGVLGNKLRTWRDPQAAQASGVPTVGIRYADPRGGGTPKFTICENPGIPAMWDEWLREGYDHRGMVVCEAAPDLLATIQGEVCRDVWGWHGLLGRVTGGKRMRDSMRDGDLKPCHGVQVLDLLHRFMDPSSRDDLEGLLEIYPAATVEFTCYSVDVGFLPNRNTIFWEVRNY